MKLRSVLFVVAIASATAGVAPPAASAVEFVPIDKVPEKVRAAMYNWHHDAELGAVTREVKPGGVVVYRARLTYTGLTYVLTISEDGKLLEVHEVH